MEYKHKEIGWFFIGLMSVSVFILIALYFATIPVELPFLIIIGLVLIATMLLFYKLTISINRDRIILTYGIGIIRIQLNIRQLESVEITRTPWYYGLGIRLSPKGLIYNMQSLKAVRISLSKNGKARTVFIGTPQPEQFKKAIEEQLVNKEA